MTSCRCRNMHEEIEDDDLQNDNEKMIAFTQKLKKKLFSRSQYISQNIDD